jgi:hypothetical protein
MPIVKDPELRQRRRSGGILAGAIILTTIVTQSFALNAPMLSGEIRAVDLVRTAGFALLVLVLAIRSTTAFTLMRRDPALDDELARANRANAARIGYWTFLVACLAAFAASLMIDLKLIEVMPFILMIGAFAPAIAFARAERRAMTAN